MKIKNMSSRDRLLSVLNFQEPDYIPCCFMIFKALRRQCKNEYEFIERQLELDIDVRVNLPEFKVHFHPDVSYREWKEFPSEGKYPLIHREYMTPDGSMSVVVNQDEDWPHGEHVPLFDDYVTSRSVKPLITERDELKPLKYLLLPPSDEDICTFREEAKKLKEFASERGLMVCGGWNSWYQKEKYEIYGSDYGAMGIDALMWLCGPTNPLYWAFDEPDFLEEIIAIIDAWNRKRLEIYLEEGVDLIIKRAWYESTDFWSPSLYRKFIAPLLKKEIEMVHQAGAKFGYIITSGIMPLIDDFINLGIDVIIGIDPVQGRETNLKILKEKTKGKICLWGGVNGFLTVEMGTEDKVKVAVEDALRILSKNNRFILSPVDNVSDNSPKTWKNVKIFIDTWKNLRGTYK